MTLLLKATDISLQKGKPILKKVSFELGYGEILTILGPSGSGKSSLLRCLNGLETVDTGEIILAGQNTKELETTEHRRRMGMVFQSPTLLPSSVIKNIRVGPRLRKENLSEEECRSLIERVGLDPSYLPRNADTLSIGEQQRVSFAQVLANRPDILLLDEPTSALDPTAILKIEELIKNIHQDLKTGTILVTHNIGQAIRFNAQTLILIDGEIIARGNINNLLADSDNVTLKNFFEGKLETKQ